MIKLNFVLRVIIILFVIFNNNDILCIQLKLKLEKQVYQFPVNHVLYRRLNEAPLRELYFYEYEKPNIKLALPVLSINIGFPPQNFSLIYSTGKQVTWVYRNKANYVELSQKYFDTKKSRTLTKFTDSYEINSFTFGTLCTKVQDYITISKNISTFMSFMLIYYLSPNSLFADGELSLTRKYLGIYSDPYITKNVSNFSLLEALYKDKYIKNKYFAHKWIKGKNEGILYIDEYPLTDDEKLYYDFHICKSYNIKSELNQFWNCFIDGVRIGDKYIKNKYFAHKWIKGKNEGILYIDEYPLTDEEKIYYDFHLCKSYNIKGELNQFWNCYIDGVRIGGKYNFNYKTEIGIFSTSEKFIFVPEKNYEVIEYIKDYSDWGKNNCILEGITAFKELHCNYKKFKYSYFPDIYINFNGYEIKLSPENIFYYDDNKKFFRLLMVLYNKKDYWVFGSLLTNKNNMIFNGENGTITFFKKRELFNSTFLANYLLYFLLFLTLAGMYFLGKIYYVNLKVKNKNVDNNPEKVKFID